MKKAGIFQMIDQLMFSHGWEVFMPCSSYPRLHLLTVTVAK